MNVIEFFEKSFDHSVNPISLGFQGYTCSTKALQSKILPKLRKTLKPHLTVKGQVKLNHKRLMKIGARGIKTNYHVVEGWIGSNPVSIVLDEKYKEVKL